MKCPICNSNEIASDKQPQPSMHAFTIIFECGTEIVQAFYSEINDYVFEVKCDGTLKRFDMDELTENYLKRRNIEELDKKGEENE